jgi:hypothetical protein
VAALRCTDRRIRPLLGEPKVDELDVDGEVALRVGRFEKDVVRRKVAVHDLPRTQPYDCRLAGLYSPSAIGGCTADPIRSHLFRRVNVVQRERHLRSVGCLCAL